MRFSGPGCISPLLLMVAVGVALGLGFGVVMPVVARGGGDFWRLVVVAASTAAVALVLIVRSMSRERRRLNDYDAEIHQVCPRCGYDLRATPGQCPECGRVVESGGRG